MIPPLVPQPLDGNRLQLVVDQRQQGFQRRPLALASL